jgi:hypothetical protein
MTTYLKVSPLLLEYDGAITPCGGPSLLLEEEDGLIIFNGIGLPP